jgi:threonine dehydrogenase-like Zn-dependent dehydrogenase
VTVRGERSPDLVVRAPGEVALEERAAPAPGPGEVLIRPDVVGLCGTDLDIVAGRVDPAYTRYPLVLGHEWSGTVASGSRVVADGIVPCGHCARRREGQAVLASAAGAAGAAPARWPLAGSTTWSWRRQAGAVLTALAAARRGGSVLLFGLPPHGETAAVPVDDLVNNDLTVRGSFGYTSSAWRDVVALLNTGRLELAFLVTHRFGLADWKQALDALRGTDSPRGKVLLEVNS